MEKKISCPFNQICFCFKEPLCFNTNIDENLCGGPNVRGARIVCVAKVRGTAHKIAIISKCPGCRKIQGIVTGDTKVIPYRMDYVDLSNEMEKKIPCFVCKTCLNLGADHYPRPTTKSQAQATA